MGVTTTITTKTSKTNQTVFSIYCQLVNEKVGSRINHISGTIYSVRNKQTEKKMLKCLSTWHKGGGMVLIWFALNGSGDKLGTADDE